MFTTSAHFLTKVSLLSFSITSETSLTRNSEQKVGGHQFFSFFGIIPPV